MKHECSRCEEEFLEGELIRRTPQRHGIEGEPVNFCSLCYLASEVLRYTRGPISEEKRLSVHPVRVYSRALGKAVKKRNGKEDELKGAYDGLITESVKEHAPDWMQENLGEAEKALQGRLPSFEKRGEAEEGPEQTQLGLDGEVEQDR